MCQFKLSSKTSNLKNKPKNKIKIFTWLLFSSPTLLPSYLFAYLGKSIVIPIFLSTYLNRWNMYVA
jgi:hypothetical protein